ncbi:hypothetical protein SAMN04489742_3631 [Arthrobacter crystallopoietes]|uniref:Uncharacterized protein n=1 Tax=Crystallibacter crystallopoietes TaxID=37928 RepID=A0A1H1FST0_9MICC|nr:hypothetical protein SAMN04489742_3631 [Arthrobacter crystallopoietes]
MHISSPETLKKAEHIRPFPSFPSKAYAFDAY